MGILRASALKDLRLRLRDPLGTLLWVGIPLAIALLMALVLGGGGEGGPAGRVLIANADEGPLGGLLAGAFSQGQLGSIFTAESVEEAAGRRRMEAGEASGLIIVPADFSQAVLHREAVTLELVTHPGQQILPGILEEGLSLLSEAVFYLQELLGDTLAGFAGGPPGGAGTFPDAQIAGWSTEINGVVRRLTDFLDPLRIELVAEEADSGDTAKEFDFLGAFLPGMVFMALLFVAQGMSEEIWREHEQGTLRRTLVGGSMAGFLGGKLLAAGALLAAVLAAGLVSTAFLVEVSGPGLLPAFVWGMAASVAFWLLMVLVQVHAGSARTGNLLTTVVLFPLLMLGGSFFPFEAMPAGMAAAGRLTPNGWALSRFRGLLDGELDPGSLAPSLGLLATATAVLFLLNLRRLRGRFGAG